MATVSPSGLGTLLGLIFIGPFIYLVRYCITKKHMQSDVIKEDDEGHETISFRSYLFALVGYAIGIGNVWRFPYVIASNGGAAAVVAYLICAVFVAWPLFTFEMILGQYLRKTFICTWETIRPRWLSFGWAQFLLLFIAQSYFSMVITYTLPYIAGSCVEPLPWADDPEAFWYDTILNSYDNLDDKPPGPGPIQTQLAVSLVIFWCITFFSVAFGKSILAKVTYVTVIMPVVLMIILVCVSVTQSGAKAGIEFYIGKFEASQLGDLSVWATALGQILLSLSPGFVFAIVGHLAEEEGVSVEEKATRSGTGLAFITIAEAMSFFGPFQNVMSVLFYVMLLTLGLDSSYACTERLVSSTEEALVARGRHVNTRIITLVLCIIMFLFGLVFTTRMGNEILDVIDMFVGTIFLLAVCFIESVILNIDLKWQRLQYALKAATFGSKRFPEGRNIFPRYLCRLDFHVTVPLATGLLCIYKIINVASEPYGGYPKSLLAWGWFLLSLCFAIVLVTIWKCNPSSLPAIEEDPHFKEVLNKDIQVKEVGDEVSEEEDGEGEDKDDGKDEEKGTEHNDDNADEDDDEEEYEMVSPAVDQEESLTTDVNEESS